MRRLVLIGSVAAAVAVLAGCGPGSESRPLPETVQGRVAGPPPGDAAAGETLFTGDGGCGACHAFAAAGTKATVGPDLDELANHAEQADHGSIADYTRESMLSPGAYITPGYPEPSPMPSYSGQLNAQQVSDIVAFLVENQPAGGGSDAGDSAQNAGGGSDEGDTPSEDEAGADSATTTGESEDEGAETTETTAAEEQEAPAETTSGQEVAAADAAAGKQVFASAGCGACHALADAGSSGTVGPNLDDAAPERELIADRVTNGRGAMPPFKGQLSDKQIADVAEYVYESTHG